MNSLDIFKRFSIVSIVLFSGAINMLAAEGDKTDCFSGSSELLAKESVIVYSETEIKDASAKKKTTKDFVFHTVTSDDKSIYQISQKYGVRLKDIYKYNKQTKREPIKVGDIVYIPKKSITKEYETTDKNSEEVKTQINKKNIVKNITPVAESQIVHVLADGETLTVLKRKYGVSLADLKKANPTLDSDHLPIGTKIIIPQKQEIVQSAIDQSSAKGDKFYYKIVSGDTYFNLQGRFYVTKEELVKMNPVLQEGLKTGVIIRIPKKELSKNNDLELENGRYTRYEVRGGETIYGIAHNNNIQIEKIVEINSELKTRGVRAGEIILLPNPNFIELTVDPINFFARNDCNGFDASQMTRPFQIGLFLPLYFDQNRTINEIRTDLDKESTTDPLKTQTASLTNIPFESVQINDSVRIRKEKIIYSKSINFMHFYEGVLLALDSLRAQGMQVELNVFDTNRELERVNEITGQPEVLDMDLFIGPVYNSLQASVANLAKKNHIPMVSPLTSDDRYTQNNPYYFQVNPTADVQERMMADFVAEKYYGGNFVVLKMNDNQTSSTVNRLRERLYGSDMNDNNRDFFFVEYNYRSEGVNGLSFILQKDRENIILIPSEKEAEISQLIGQLAGFVNDYEITLVGMSNWTKYSSIKLESLHKLNTIYLSFYQADYSTPEIKNVVRNFRENYKTEPNKFSFQGYDIAYYFGSALGKYGRDFSDCLSNHKVHLTQSDYNFVKVGQLGGYMNQAFKVVQFGRDYNLRVIDEIGKYPTHFPNVNEGVIPSENIFDIKY